MSNINLSVTVRQNKRTKTSSIRARMKPRLTNINTASGPTKIVMNTFKSDLAVLEQEDDCPIGSWYHFVFWSA